MTSENIFQGEEFEKLTEIKDIFSQKVNQYIGAKRIKRQTFSYVTDKYLSSHNKSNEESQELIIGKLIKENISVLLLQMEENIIILLAVL